MGEDREILGGMFRFLAGACFLISGIIGLIVCLSIVVEVAGFLGFIIAFFIFPVTLLVAPWYALIAWKQWFPLAITYGGTILSWIFYTISSLISGESYD